MYRTDLVIFAKNGDSHIAPFWQVSTQIPDAGASVKLRTCRSLAGKINYLEHVIQLGRMEHSEVTIEALQELQKRHDSHVT